jgi:hypothetical protein
MSVYFVNYADENYRLQQANLKERCKTCKELKGYFLYDRSSIEATEFYEENKKILNMKRGGGYCLWKPYIILDSFDYINEEEIIFYLDSGDDFKCEAVDIIKERMSTRNILLFDGVYLNKNWTKRDCFVQMNCDEAKYWDTIQLEAGICVFKKCDQSIRILNEWISHSSNPRIGTDLENQCEEKNFENFVDHRDDQSVITNLAVKHDLPRESFTGELRNFIHCNVQNSEKAQGNHDNSKLYTHLLKNEGE